MPEHVEERLEKYFARTGGECFVKRLFGDQARIVQEHVSANVFPWVRLNANSVK
jgi:hypothetical protein